MRELLDAGCSGATNTRRQTLSAVSRKPRKLRGFRVLAVDFSPAYFAPVWRKNRQFLPLFLRPCGLPDCQVHRMVFGIPCRSKSYVWSRESGFMASMPAKPDGNDCNDPAVPAQVRPLTQKPQRVSSCPAPDADAGGCRTGSNRRSHGWRAAGSRTGVGARTAPSASGSGAPPTSPRFQ
jgi:hypothetical protein